MSMFFKAPLEIEIRLQDEQNRMNHDTKTVHGRLESLPVYQDGESVTGTITIRTREGREVEHLGVKVQLLGSIETNTDGVLASEFLSLATELASPGHLKQPETYPFEFKNVQKQYESYRGKNVTLRYYIKVLVARKSSQDVKREKEIWVFRPNVPIPKDSDAGPLAAPPAKVKVDVGIPDCLHIEFEHQKSTYSLKDVIVGKIYFFLVRLKIKHMELSLIRRESVGLGLNSITDSKTIARMEIMDGAPVKGEVIPIRLFLSGFDLCPTYVDVNKKFLVRTFLLLVLIDEDARRYFKQSEITLYRDQDQ